ncbi:hypothetical protein VP95_28270 [Burkholderia pseudomallei]|nr:hypothetical protein VP95_28270 [Burkholderia pseudomallei]OND59081.1 hypothetical protein AQ936_14625 [Burkholderia pseudomallei]OND63590.1 hypothetical protein AQ937_07080 [Burkholderia pseudomallei]OND74755.1 hypothetical protein AQ939_05075 [Burkholderia pseudomallei]
MSRISPVAPRRLPRRPAERAPRRRFPVSSCWPFLWCADVVSRRNGSALVQSKGRAIARKRPRDKASATKAGNRGRLMRGVLIHRRINPGKAVARAATGCVCGGVRVYAHVARVRCHAGERAGEQATAARAARRRRKRLIVAGVRRPVRAAAIVESMLSPGRVSESIRFAKAGAAGRLRPIAVGKSLTQSAAPRTARTRHASRACARSMRAQGFRAGVPAAGRAARRHRAVPAPQAARPCRAARDAGRRARAP